MVTNSPRSASRKRRGSHLSYRKVVALSEQIKSFVLANRSQRNEYIQSVAQIAYRMRNNEVSWGELCKDEFWNGKKSQPNVDKIEKIEFWILKYVLGEGRNSQKNASFYNEAITALLVGNIPRQNIAEEIEKRGGLKKIVDGHRENLKKSAVGQSGGAKQGSAKRPKATSQERSKRAGSTKKRTSAVSSAGERVEFLVTKEQLKEAKAVKKGDGIFACLIRTNTKAGGLVGYKAVAIQAAPLSSVEWKV